MPDITGSTFVDANGNSIHDSGEQGAGGQTIFLDDNGNGAFDIGEKTTVSEPDGSWTMSGLVLADLGKKVYQSLPSELGWTVTLGADGYVVGDPTVPAIAFGMFPPFSITGSTFVDANGNSIHDSGEQGAGGQTIFLDDDGNGAFDIGEKSTVTDTDGSWTLSGLVFADLGKKVYQSLLADLGWAVTLGADGYVVGDPTVPAEMTFGMFPPFSVTGSTFVDSNGNSIHDSGEPGAGGQTIFLDDDVDGAFDAGEKTAVSDAGGSWTMSGLAFADLGKKVYQHLEPSLGWAVTLGADGYVVGDPTEPAEITFGVSPPFSITGFTFVDANGNSIHDSGEPGTGGQTIFLDDDGNGAFDAGEKTAVSDADGSWTMSGLAFADLGKKVYQHLEAGLGWAVTLGADGYVVGDPTVPAIAFGMFPPFSITGFTFIDANGNSIHDSSEPFANVPTVFLDDNDNGMFDAGEKEAVSGGDGSWTMSGLVFADLGKKVYQHLEPSLGWAVTLGADGYVVGDPTEPTEMSFGVFPPFSITGFTFIDANGNSIHDSSEPFANVPTVFLDDNDNGMFDAGEKEAVSGGDGSWTMSGLVFADLGKKVYQHLEAGLGWAVTLGADGYVVGDPTEPTEMAFGVYFAIENFTISGFKLLDQDGDGDITEDATLLDGFTIFIDDDDDGIFDAGERSTITGSDSVGAWSIAGLTPDDVGKRVYEVAQDGWTQTVGMGGFVIVNPGSGGEQTGLNFGNFENFTISGYKLEDEDGDGNVSEDATLLDGITIFIDDDGDGVFDPGERSTVTTFDEGGFSWSLEATPADAGKRVHEVAPDGWTVTAGADGFLIVNPGSGGEQTRLDFGNFENFTVSGRKALDINGDGGSASETFLGGFTVFVDDDGDGVFDAGERSAVSADLTGLWSIGGLTPDDVGKRVYEATPDGWTTTFGMDGYVIVNPGSGGEQTNLDFNNFENFTISGRKVQDDDGDGNIAEDATFLGGFTIFVDDDGDGVLDAGERSTVSADGTGLWSITNLAPEDAGKRVYEVTPSGWTQTVGTGGFVIANPGSGGEQTGLDFGNFEDFTISGRKVLDADGDGNLAEEATFLGGFTIFVDDDGDGVLDAGERSTLTAIDTTGSWSISGLTPDDVGKRVYEVVPSDWTQTVGIGGLVIVNPGSGGEQTGMDFGNTDRNDAPVIRGGDSAIYFVRVNSAGITTIVATDADSSVITYSIVGGTDAGRFMINASTGELAFDKHAAPANRSYVLQVQAADGAGGADQQDITINVVADKMKGDAAQAVAETFVFHPKFGANSISNFDVGQDFLQFDSGMFAADTAAAVLATARDNKKGDVIIDIQAGHLEILGVTKAELQAHPEQFLFV